MVKDLTPVEEGVLNLRLSDLRTWLQCPRRFYFEVLEGLYPRADNADADKDIEYEIADIDEEYVVTQRPAKRRDEGTMAHAVVQAHYEGRLAEHEFDPVTRLLLVDEIVDGAAEELTTDINEPTWIEARRYAKAMARGFVPWLELEGHDVGRTVLSVEKRFTRDIPFRFDPYHTIRITGQPDLIEQDEMTEETGIGDTKTVQSLKNTGPRESDFQLVGYSWILAASDEWDTPTYGYQNLLARSLQTSRAKGPFYRRVPISIPYEKVQAFDKNLRTQVTRMGKTIWNLYRNDMPPERLAYSETNLCDWICKTSLVCDAMSSGQPGRWESLANEYYGGTFEEAFDD